MTRTAFLCVGLSLAILFLSNFSSKPASKFVMTVVNDEPVLPAQPFKYNEVKIPEHLKIPDIETGVALDTLVFTRINNYQATLGRVLFYDKKLSAQENISCGSCHDQSLSFTENKSFSEGILNDTKRNSLHLNDLGWINKDHFAWDMRKNTLRDMIQLPLTDENEIGADMDDIAIKLESTTYYSSLFEQAFGSADINEERIIEALAVFIESMHTLNSKFDKEADREFKGFTDRELGGFFAFAGLCGPCHSQGSGIKFSEIDLFEDSPFVFNNGLPRDEDDKGRGEWNEGFDELFKAPTLRNIELTAPYMHDGRFNTLEEVVDHYSEDVLENEWTSDLIPIGGFQLTDHDKGSLVEFMKTLTDKTFGSEEKWSDPFGLTDVDRLELEDVVLKPNPTVDQAYIEFKNKDGRMVSVNILSAEGRLIKHDQTNGAQYVLGKDFFGPGLYYVELIMDDRRSVQKLIVQ